MGMHITTKALFSKMVHKGMRGQKSPKICQHGLQTTPLLYYFVNLTFSVLSCQKSFPLKPAVCPEQNARTGFVQVQNKPKLAQPSVSIQNESSQIFQQNEQNT